MYIAIVSCDENGRFPKYAECDNEASAQAHVSAHGGFYVQTPQGGFSDWLVDMQAETVTYSPQSPVITVDMVIDERERRLAGGFQYDFGDSRGVHTIGTTRQDMRGWDEVTALAQARIATSDTTAISIATDTGQTAVTPLEWMGILKAAGGFRQPIWGYSFALEAMDPIPSDYKNDSYWE